MEDHYHFSCAYMVSSIMDQITNTPPKTFDEYLSGYRITDSDQRYLESLESIVSGIALCFGEHCEVVLHSLDDLAHSVIRIKNGTITGRGVRAPVTNVALDILADAFEHREDVIGPYFSTTEKGASIKSVTILLRNPSGVPIGLLCINFDLTVGFLDFVRAFSPPVAGIVSPKPPVSKEIYPDELEDLVKMTLKSESESLAAEGAYSSSKKNRMLIQALERKHIFKIKGAVELVARALGLSRHTIYSRLREIRRNDPN